MDLSVIMIMVRLPAFENAGLWLTNGAAFLFTPNIPFMSKPKRRAPFFGLQDRMPVVLALLLGFQHCKYIFSITASGDVLLSTLADSQ
jgi:hypothetical protein